ncbi:MAG: VWA domain-containing protein [Candidatus Hodarchaeota archaeon]
MPIEGETIPNIYLSGEDFMHNYESFPPEDDLSGKTILLSFLDYEEIIPGNSTILINCLLNLCQLYSTHCIQIVIVFPVLNGTTELTVKTWLEGLGVNFPAIHSFDIWRDFMTGITDGTEEVRPHSFILEKIDPDNWIIRKRYCVLPPVCSDLEDFLLSFIDVREPIDLEMVMDVSGSMNSIPPNANETKYEMMKKAITIVGTYLKDNAHCDDRMGLIWFTDEASDYSRNNQKLFRIKTNWDELSVQVNNHGTGNCTAMGAGLQTAINTLSSSNQKFVILCTDGMQNINPMVLDLTAPDGSVYYAIVNDDVRYRECGPHSQVEPSGTDISSYNTCVHTIGIGIIEDYDLILDGIATETQGFYQETNNPGDDLLGDYFVALLDCLGRGSPSILYINNGNLSIEEHEKSEIFHLNSSVRKITVIISWKKSQGSNFMFWLYTPDGVLLDLHNEMRIYEHHCMATIYLPKRQNGDNLEYIGEWRMMIRGEIPNSSADYNVIIIGEDKDIKLVFDFPRKRFEVGDLLPIKVFILKKKKPLAIEPKEITIEKKLLLTPLPELIAKYKISPNELLEKTKTIPDRAPKNLLNLKLKVMTSDPKFQKSLIPDIKRFSLQRGNLECKFEKEEVLIPIALEQPGTHNFKIRVRYESPEEGPICRTHMISIIVEPGKVDPKQSDFRKKGKMIYITPRNKKGQLFGPGYSHKFKLQAGEKEYDIEFKDLLDGTYQIELPEKVVEEIKEKKLDVDIIFRKNVIWRRKL